MSSPTTNPFALLPSVERILLSSPVAGLIDRVGRDLVARFLGEELARWREEIRRGELDAEVTRLRLEGGELLRTLEERIRREEGSGLTCAVNAAGVVLHTGLGRAPMHVEAAKAMEEAARSFCVLEVDRFTGERNQRDDRLAELLCRLTGAEGAIVVNNNAAAVLLILSTFAEGRETIVSRGELVEIGGSFRMPDVMARAGTKLVEVGTTNRTRIEDYRRAARPDTGLLLEVHSSNYRMVGFTEQPGSKALVELGRELGITAAFDLGSGLLETEGVAPLDVLPDEPLVREAVEVGMDVVSFSGDKLLGGPQAGLIVGRDEAIAAMRDNALYRALRLDKVTIAGLERTLELLLEGRGGEIPARRMLLATADELHPEAEALAADLRGIEGLSVEVAEDTSQPGSGSAPGVFLPTWVVRVRAEELSASELSAELRAGDPPVFARIQDQELLLDPRTFLPGDADRVFDALSLLMDRVG